MELPSGAWTFRWPQITRRHILSGRVLLVGTNLRRLAAVLLLRFARRCRILELHGSCFEAAPDRLLFADAFVVVGHSCPTYAKSISYARGRSP